VTASSNPLGCALSSSRHTKNSARSMVARLAALLGMVSSAYSTRERERERERDQHLRIGVLASVAHTRRAALQMLRRSDVSNPIGAATADAGSATRRISSNCSSNLQQPGVNANARVHGGADQEPHRCAGMACWSESSTTCTTKNCSRQSTTMCRESV